MRKWLEPDITGPLLFRRPEHVQFDLHGPPVAERTGLRRIPCKPEADVEAAI